MKYLDKNGLTKYHEKIKKKIDDKMDKSDFINTIYPIGSLYMSVNDNADPNTLFPGTAWERILGRYLIARDPGIDGEFKHNISKNELGAWNMSVSDCILTIDQIPAHKHEGLYWIGTLMGLDASGDGGCNWPVQWTGASDSGPSKISVGETGGGQPHSHSLPLYPIPTFVANFWYRVK